MTSLYSRLVSVRLGNQAKSVLKEFTFSRVFINFLKEKSNLISVSTFFVFLVYLKIYYTILMTDGHGDLGWLRIVLWRNPSLSLEGFPGYPSSYSSWEWHFLPYISIWSALSYLWPFGDLNYLLLFITLPPVLIFFY